MFGKNSKIRKVAVSIKKWIVSLEPTSKTSQVLLVFTYKSLLKIFGKYKRRRESAFEVIENNVSPEDFANKKKMNKLYNQILYCRFMYQINAREYFTYEFNKLSHEGRKTFITRGNKYPFYRKFNNSNYIPYLNMKTESYRKYKEYYKRDVLPMYDNEDYEAFLDFIKKHPKFIYKPSVDYGGQGINIYNVDDYDNPLDLFKILIFNGYCVLEELIVQAEPLASVHPSSVNTVRLVAFRKSDGDIIIQWAIFRMGMGGSITDNMSGGGLGAMIDPETGIIYATGRDYLGKDVIFHPDTGVKLIGFEMPDWENLLNLVKELAAVIPQVRIVGWDLAYTDRGWVLIEPNARPQCLTAQIPTINGRLHQYKEIEKIFDEEVSANER